MNLHFLKTRLHNVLFRTVDYFVRCDSKFSLLLVFVFDLVSNGDRQINLLPVEWLDENKTGFRKTLESEELGYSYGPFIRGSQCVEQVLLPAVNLYYFENVRVCVTSSSILLDNKIIIERVKGAVLKRCSYAAGHVVRHGQNSAIVRKLTMEYLDKGIFLGGNGSFNYYHWMIEILPKLQYLQNLNEGYQDFPLLVSEDIAHICTFHEALDLIIKDRAIVTLDKSKSYCVGKLIYINAPNNCPFNLKENQKLKISDFVTRKSSVNFLRNRLSANLSGSVKIGGGKRIFFARRSERRNYNQDEIYKLFERQGFTKVFMEDLSLKNQIDLISNAEMIAGPTGAAWTNLIFCREGTKCLCWMPDEAKEFSGYSNLARIVGADLRYITYRTGAKSTGELYTLRYHVDPKKIEKELYALISASR